MGEIPAPILPWAIIFDHEGNRVFAGNLKGFRDVLDATLARAPDRIIGGPYPALKKIASRMAKEKKKLGPSMKILRDIAADESGKPDARRDAEALLSRLDQYGETQFDRAEGLLPNVIGANRIYEDLALLFAGDAIGDRASKLHKELTSDKGFKKEVEAAGVFEKARREFRKRPPAVTYAYNLSFTKITNKSAVDKRTRITAAYRNALKKIIEKYPDTFAASESQDVLDYDLDEDED